MRPMPQTSAGRFADIACLLAARKNFSRPRAVRRDGQRIEAGNCGKPAAPTTCCGSCPSIDENGRQDGVVMTLTGYHRSAPSRPSGASQEHPRAAALRRHRSIRSTRSNTSIRVLQSDPAHRGAALPIFHGLPGAVHLVQERRRAGRRLSCAGNGPRPRARTDGCLGIPASENAGGSVSKLEIFQRLSPRRKARPAQNWPQSRSRQRSVLARHEQCR